MYKVIYNNEVIDVVTTLKYRRFLEASNKAVSTDRCSAHGIVGSNNKDIYAFEGYGTESWPEVSIIEISETEYTELSRKLSCSKLKGISLILHII